MEEKIFNTIRESQNWCRNQNCGTCEKGNEDADCCTRQIVYALMEKFIIIDKNDEVFENFKDTSILMSAYRSLEERYKKMCQKFEEAVTTDTSTPVERLIFVEDGSIDVEDLKILLKNNPDIRVVTYRQGSREPDIRHI